MRIREMTSEDLGPATAVLQRARRGDAAADPALYLSAPESYPLVAVADGAIAGTAVAVRRGRVGWIGHVFVDPEYRGSGIGIALAEAGVARLEELGCRTQILVAQTAGRPACERLGFALETHYRLFRGPRLAYVPGVRRLRPLGDADLPEVCRLDQAATGEDRAAHLKAVCRTGWVVTDPETGDVRGYHIRTPWGAGPIIARDPEAGRLLLSLSRTLGGPQAGDEAEAALPEGNAAGLAHVLEEGFQETGRLLRMVRGEPLQWQPESVWGRFSAAMG